VTVPAVPVATSLSITRQPAGSASGVALTTQPIVQVLDQFGALISSTASIAAAIGSGTPTISAGTPVSAVAGVATFATLTLNAGATASATITFSSAGLASVTSNAVTCVVTPVNVATALAIETQPSGSTSPNALTTQPRVLVVDQFGAQFPSTATITASVFSGTATISAGATKAAVAGAALFTALAMTSATTQDVALQFTASGLTGIISAPFTVTVIPVPPPIDPPPVIIPPPDPTPEVLVPTSMRIKVLPTAIISGGVVSPAPQVEILDQHGAVLDIDILVVTCIATGATVTQGGSDTTQDGLAVFTGLVVT
jgi:hypothetical protein